MKKGWTTIQAFTLLMNLFFKYNDYHTFLIHFNRTIKNIVCCRFVFFFQVSNFRVIFMFISDEIWYVFYLFLMLLPFLHFLLNFKKKITSAGYFTMAIIP